MHSFKIKQFKNINFEKISIGAVLDESMQLYADDLYLADFKLNNYDLFESNEKILNKLIPENRQQYHKCKKDDNIEMYSENCKFGKNIYYLKYTDLIFPKTDFKSFFSFSSRFIQIISKWPGSKIKY